ncbi:hypothetical protein, partial [Cellulomonas triticagri]
RFLGVAADPRRSRLRGAVVIALGVVALVAGALALAPGGRVVTAAATGVCVLALVTLVQAAVDRSTARRRRAHGVKPARPHAPPG